MKAKYGILVATLVVGLGMNIANANDVDFELDMVTEADLIAETLAADEDKDARPTARPDARPAPAACRGARIEQAQQIQIRDLAVQARKNEVALVKAVKDARTVQTKALRDPKSNLAAGEAASAAVIQSTAALATARATLRNTILFSVLQPAQRAAVLNCLQRARHHARGRVDHDRGHGRQDRGQARRAPHGRAQRHPGRPAPTGRSGRIVR